MSTIQVANFVSDTVTKPTPGMLKAMMEAEVGDDVFGEDPTVNALQKKLAAMFGKEAGLFCPTGTMSNQIAMKINTQPLDELLCDWTSHVFQFEVGAHAVHSGITIHPLRGDNGKITPQAIRDHVRPEADWLARTSLVVVENTMNMAGGGYYTLDEVKAIRETCNQLKLKLHLDGARIFNALVESKNLPQEFGELFDTISVCLSKGLGAPVGSVLLGTQEDIKRARRFRKALGGGMRQAGYLAAAGIYALDNHVERLSVDNQRAKKIGEILSTARFVAHLRPVYTNMVIFELKAPWTTTRFVSELEKYSIKTVAFGANVIRFVFHLDITEEMFERLAKALQDISEIEI